MNRVTRLFKGRTQNFASSVPSQYTPLLGWNVSVAGFEPSREKEKV